MQRGIYASLSILTLLTIALFTPQSAHAQGGDSDEGRIYWSQPTSIVRAKMDGTDPETILIGLKLRAPVFNADGTQMYGIGTDDVIRRANVDGSALTEILTPGNDPTNLRIDTTGSKLYWLDDTGVRRANLNGDLVETLVMSQTNPIGLRLDLENGKLYWSDDSRHIRRANLDGTMLETIYSVPTDDDRVGCVSIDPAANKAYWLLHDGLFRGSMLRANTDGSGVETLPLEDICPVLNTDNDKLYWVVREQGNGSIQRSNLDGTNIEEIVADAATASNGLTFDPAGGKIYWYESTLEDSVIRRANLDGGPAEDLVPLPTNGSGLYLNLAQQKMIWDIQGELRSADLDGSNVASVLVGINTAGQLALDLEGGRIFWGDSSSIRVADLDGTNTEIFWTATNDTSIGFSFGPSLIQTDAEAGKLYWITLVITEPTIAQNSRRVLFSANLDGSGLQEEGTIPLQSPFAIDFVNQKVYGYFQNADDLPLPQQFNRELSSVNFDGSNRIALGIFDNQGGINVNIAVDGVGGKLYWTVGGTIASIQHANLDGSEQSELIDDVASTDVLDVDSASGKLYWSRTPGGDANITERANLDGTERETVLDDDVRAFAFDPEGLGTPAPEETDQDLHMPFILGE